MAVAQTVQWSEVDMKGCGMITGPCRLRAEVSLRMKSDHKIAPEAASLVHE